jgi:hypothetical protein
MYNGLWEAHNRAGESTAAARGELDEVWTNYLTFTDLARDEVGVLDIDQ